MAALTELYVDPSIAADSGAGTIGDPYGDLEYAIEQETFDVTNGIRINIKAGTDEILAVALNDALVDVGSSIAWVPVEAAPLVFQGYTAAAGDGGIGGINGGGSVGIFADAIHNYVHFIDCHIHNCGAAAIIDLNDFCAIIRCECDNTSGDGLLGDTAFLVFNSHIHNVGGVGTMSIGSGQILFNTFENGANDFTTAIDTANALMYVYRNIISIDGTSDGIGAGQEAIIINNSIYSAGGSGQGIVGTGARISSIISNNIVEGFSAGGGIGYDLDNASFGVKIYGGNSAYNNATEYTDPGDYTLYQLGGASSNETLSTSAFTNAAEGNFNPISTGSVEEGSFPNDFGER